MCSFQYETDVITGKEDFLRPHGEELLKSVIDPVVIHHPKGHTVPRIGLGHEPSPVLHDLMCDLY